MTKSYVICILLCHTTTNSSNLKTSFITKTPCIGRSCCNVKNKSYMGYAFLNWRSRRERKKRTDEKMLGPFKSRSVWISDLSWRFLIKRSFLFQGNWTLKWNNKSKKRIPKRGKIQRQNHPEKNRFSPVSQQKASKVVDNLKFCSRQLVLFILGYNHRTNIRVHTAFISPSCKKAKRTFVGKFDYFSTVQFCIFKQSYIFSLKRLKM